jgi:hypothetical protein
MDILLCELLLTVLAALVAVSLSLCAVFDSQFIDTTKKKTMNMYYGHILNLAAQALISPEDDDDALLPQNNDGVSLVPSKEEIEKWRKKGPLGKPHIAVYIQRSPQRLAEFEKYSNGKRIPRDNSTRWNSWYHIINASMAETMRPAITHFCTKYYDITDRSKTYTASVVLNPTQKWQAFPELQWSDEWITAARKQVGNLWEKEYKKKELDALPGSAGITADLELTDFDIWMESKRERTLDEDEYARYCSSQRMDLRKGISFDARKWWSETSRRLEYPNLSKMALDLLSIPAMSASPERLFSTAKLTVTDRRNRLSPQAIEALECLKLWYKIGRLGEFTQPEK